MAGCRDDHAAIQVEGVMQVSKSLDGVVTAKVGESRTIRITFSAGEASPLSALAVDNMPQGLPAGWSGPTGFSCPSVTSGSEIGRAHV